MTRRRLSLSLKKPPKQDKRFASPIKHELLEKAAEGVVPKNTRHSTTWSVKTFLSWVAERNERVENDKIEDDILFSTDCKRLSYHSYVLRLFVLEARKSNGESYPPSNLRNILSGINAASEQWC